jgi:hypothetical protein
MLHYILNDQLLHQPQPIHRRKMIHLVKQLRYSTVNSVMVAVCLNHIYDSNILFYLHVTFLGYNLNSYTRYSRIRCNEPPLHSTLACWVGLGALWYFRLSWVWLKLSWGISCMTAIETFVSSLLQTKRNTAHVGRDRTTNVLTHIRVA